MEKTLWRCMTSRDRPSYGCMNFSHFTFRLLTLPPQYIPLATVDAADLSWSPCGSYIVVLDNLMQVRRSLIVGPRQADSPQTTTHILSASGRPLATYDLDMHGSTSALNLGFNKAIWHPSGGYLMLCRADDSLHILNTQSWRCAKIVRMPWSQWGLPRSASDGQPRARLVSVDRLRAESSFG